METKIIFATEDIHDLSYYHNFAKSFCPIFLKT